MISRKTILLALVTTMLLPVHRLPAPISEAPTPEATSESRPKPAKSKPKKPKSDESAGPSAKSHQAPLSQFEGTWTGTISTTAQATLFFTTKNSATASITLRISKTGVVTYAAEPPVQGWLSADGQILSWVTDQRLSTDMVSHKKSALRLVAAKTASYSDATTYDGIEADVSSNSTGTLYKH